MNEKIKELTTYLYSYDNDDRLDCEAADMLIELQSRLESLEKDAARYQWLRFANLDEAARKYWPNGEVPEGEGLDNAIDTAMQANRE